MEWGLIGLFSSAFLAATVLPLSSEAVLIGLFYAGDYDPVTLWATATAGNVGGSLINWYLGRYMLSYADRSWFPVSQERLQSAQKSYLEWGRWSLLLAWLPIIGDPLTLVAGLFRTPLFFFTLLVFLGKGGRYLALLWLI
jgi:membrane protein YqaA with SNARE-associated domain